MAGVSDCRNPCHAEEATCISFLGCRPGLPHTLLGNQLHIVGWYIYNYRYSIRSSQGITRKVHNGVPFETSGLWIVLIERRSLTYARMYENLSCRPISLQHQPHHQPILAHRYSAVYVSFHDPDRSLVDQGLDARLKIR